MAVLGDGSRVLQVHPTRACNLRCPHGSSSSGPEERDPLPATLLREVVKDGAAEGYSTLAVSGGEPLLYPALRDLLDEALAQGMATTLTTNGLLLDDRRLEELRGRLDLLAISLDGVPESHDRRRGRAGAFTAMEERLEGVRESGIPFGFLFTLTRSNAHELGWIADYAAAQGASLLRIHPLEEAGCAHEALPGQAPDDFEAAFAWVAAMRLAGSMRGRLRIHVDLLDRAVLAGGLGAPVWLPPTEDTGLADLVAPLVIEADGAVVPFQHGFARAFALGSLEEARLRFLGVRWRRHRLPAFAALLRRTLTELSAPAELPIVNWYEEVARRAAA